MQDACEHYDITIWELDVAYENQTQPHCLPHLHIDMKRLYMHDACSFTCESWQKHEPPTDQFITQHGFCYAKFPLCINKIQKLALLIDHIKIL